MNPELEELPLSVKNELKDIFRNYAISGNCRSCKFFIRVKKNYRDVMRQVGFCRLGRLEGDYSLYYSWSGDRTCRGFIEDNYNRETYLAECFLHMKHNKFKTGLWDKRTKMYKVMEKHFLDREDILSILGSDDAWIAYAINQEFRKAFYELFIQLYKKEFDWLWNRRMLSEKDYHQFLNKIQTELDKVVCTNGFSEVVGVFE